MGFHGFSSILPAILTGLTFSDLVHVFISAMHSCVQHHFLDEKALFSSSSLALTFKIPQPCFILVEWDCDIDVLCGTKDSMVCYLLCLLCVSVVTSIYHKKVYLWWGLRDAPICGYGYTYLRNSLVLCPFSWIILGSSPQYSRVYPETSSGFS